MKHQIVRLLPVVGLLLTFFGTRAWSATIYVSGPARLTQAGAYYVLTQDVSAPGTAFTIAAGGITFDLNGHTVIYNTATGDNVYGVLVTWNQAHVRITNGTLQQGAGNGSYCSAI